MFRSRKARTLFMSVAFAVAWPSLGQAQQVLPLLDCVSFDVATNTLTAYFGYGSGFPNAVVFDLGSQNYFSPGAIYRGQPTTFQPGEHRRVLSTSFMVSGRADRRACAAAEG